MPQDSSEPSTTRDFLTTRAGGNLVIVPPVITQGDESLNKHFELMNRFRSKQALNEGAWHKYLHRHRHRLTPYTTTPLKTSLALIAGKAFVNDLSRSNVAVQVSKLCTDENSSGAMLSDATGSIQSTFLADVLKEHCKTLEDGCVLLLENVRAILYPPRQPNAYFVDLNEGLNMTISAKNITYIAERDAKLSFDPPPLRFRYTQDSVALPSDLHAVYYNFRNGCVYNERNRRGNASSQPNCSNSQIEGTQEMTRKRLVIDDTEDENEHVSRKKTRVASEEDSSASN